MKENAIGGSGKPRLTIKALARWVNEKLNLEGDLQYSEHTICEWMHFLGFNVEMVCKALYVDGHERADVVADRQRFARELEEITPHLLTIDDNTLEIASNPQAKFILISQDEKIYHSNDIQKRYWPNGEYVASFQKSLGRTVMTSDFLSEIYVFIKLGANNEMVRGRHVGSVLDVSSEGYYESSICLADFPDCSAAVQAMTGACYKCVFMTDNSPIHCKMAADALKPRAMNVKPGGLQPHVGNGWCWKNGERIQQSVTFSPDHPEFPNQPKGLRQVVLERFGKETSKGLKHDDLVQLLSNCDDFSSQKTLLEEQAEEHGDKVIYGVKFHPELAPIEAAYR